MRFPLFTLRITGDGLVAALKGIVRLLPVPGSARGVARARQRRLGVAAAEDQLQGIRGRASSRIRAGHGVGVQGMPDADATRRIAGHRRRGALASRIVRGGDRHARRAHRQSNRVPAWMQLLHPLATIIAKSKLLVLPVYPAAWPQAKQHPFVQGPFRFYRYVAARYLMRKTGLRYRQTERAATEGARVLRRSAIRIGLRQLSERLLNGLNDLAARIGKAMRAMATGAMQGLAGLPLIGPIIRRYEKHYGAAAEQESPQKLSEKIKGFYERWSIKLSTEYYEAKEAEAATSQAAQSQAVRAIPPMAVARRRSPRRRLPASQTSIQVNPRARRTHGHAIHEHGSSIDARRIGPERARPARVSPGLHSARPS